jgi:hypothetical protein
LVSSDGFLPRIVDIELPTLSLRAKRFLYPIAQITINRIPMMIPGQNRFASAS